MSQNMLQKGSSMLHRIRREKIAVAVEYRRGTTMLALQATVGFSRFEKVDDAGVHTLTRTRDYIFRSSELTLQNPCTPIEGDVIAETIAGELKIFEVIQGGQQGCYRREGLADEAIRVHAVETGREP